MPEAGAPLRFMHPICVHKSSKLSHRSTDLQSAACWNVAAMAADCKSAFCASSRPPCEASRARSRLLSMNSPKAAFLSVLGRSDTPQRETLRQARARTKPVGRYGRFPGVGSRRKRLDCGLSARRRLPGGRVRAGATSPSFSSASIPRSFLQAWRPGCSKPPRRAREWTSANS